MKRKASLFAENETTLWRKHERDGLSIFWKAAYCGIFHGTAKKREPEMSKHSHAQRVTASELTHRDWLSFLMLTLLAPFLGPSGSEASLTRSVLAPLADRNKYWLTFPASIHLPPTFATCARRTVLAVWRNTNVTSRDSSLKYAELHTLHKSTKNRAKYETVLALPNVSAAA